MSVVDNIFNDLERNPAAAAVYCDAAFSSMPSIAARAQCGSKKKKVSLVTVASCLHVNPPQSCHTKLIDLFSEKLYLIGLAALAVAVIMVSVRLKKCGRKTPAFISRDASADYPHTPDETVLHVRWIYFI